MRPGALLLLAACGSQDPGPDPLPDLAPHAPQLSGPAPTAAAPLPPARLLRRLRLDLNGVLPNTPDLDRVHADPTAFAELREDYLADPLLQERIVDLLAERWLTRVDSFDADYFDYGLSTDQAHEFRSSVGEEPLRLAAWLVAHDQPWSGVVTADHGMSNEMLAEIWPLDYPEGASGWQPAPWTDARPAAGLLVSNGLWWRYTTNRFNQNRSRAAAIFRLFVCADFLTRPVSFGELDPEAVDEGGAPSVLEAEYCLACHAAIEPVTATLFGFWWSRQYSVAEMTTYHAERETMGPELVGVDPAWFGQPVTGLEDLGQHIAADPRFASCAVETFGSGLLRRELRVEDASMVLIQAAAFEAGGMQVKQLLRNLSDTAEYQAGSLTEEAGELEEDRVRTARLLSPDQLREVSAQLAGFTWSHKGYEQLSNDASGYRVMAGGIDGYQVTRLLPDPSLTWALTIQRIAEGSADQVFERDVRGSEGRLLHGIDLDTTPDDPAFSTALGQAIWQMRALEAEDHELEALTELWWALDALEGPESAWRGVLSRLFQDPEFVTY